MPTIALAVMTPSAAASNAGTLNIATEGPTSGGNVTFWMVTVENTSGIDISSGSLQLVVPKGADYRIADNSTYPWSKADTGSAFTYTYNSSVFGGNAAPTFRFEFARFPPDSTGSPTVTITAMASGFTSTSTGLVVPY